MTAGGFSEVDHDLLADYLGGALDGTPEEATVARLVAEDADWAQAHDALAPALAQVRADLSGWAGDPPEMPLAVADRIAAALAGAGPAAVPDGPAQAWQDNAPSRRIDDDPDTPPQAPLTPAAPTPVVGPATGARPSGGVPAQPGGGSRRTGGSRPVGSGPGRGRRRWTRLAGPVAVAAAAMAAVGLGVDRFVTGGISDEAPNAALSGPAAEQGDAAAAAPFRTTGTPQRSGTDYTPQTLAGAAATLPPKTTVDGPASAPAALPQEAETKDRRMPFAGGLDRLTDPAALTACLGEITAEHGRAPITVELVDYAAFRGEPAVVVRFLDDAVGERWAWVSGPECGVPGSAADTRYRTRVG